MSTGAYQVETVISVYKKPYRRKFACKRRSQLGRHLIPPTLHDLSEARALGNRKQSMRGIGALGRHVEKMSASGEYLLIIRLFRQDLCSDQGG